MEVFVNVLVGVTFCVSDHVSVRVLLRWWRRGWEREWKAGWGGERLDMAMWMMFWLCSWSTGVSVCDSVLQWVCVRWDPLWAEDKQLKERTEKLKKPQRPNSIVRYCNHPHPLFSFTDHCSGFNVILLLSALLLKDPQPPQLSYCCYALLHVDCVRGNCCIHDWNLDRISMFISVLVPLLTVYSFCLSVRSCVWTALCQPCVEFLV